MDETGRINLKKELGKEISEKHTIAIESYLSELGFGMGQFFIWGFFFLIPIAKMSQLYLVLIIVPYLRCEWNLTTEFEVAIGSVTHIVRALTGIPLGGLADKYGRKKVLICSIITFTLTGIIAASSPNKWVFLSVRVAQGFAMGLCSHIPFVYVVEVASSKYKEMAILSVAVSTYFGCVYVSGVSFFLLNSIGWRCMMVIVTVPMPLIVIGLLFTPESPRYALVSKGKEGALKSLETLYRLNGKVMPTICLSIKGDENAVTHGKVEERGNLRSLFSQGFAVLTILLLMMNFGHNFLSSGFGAYLPLYKSSENFLKSNVSSELKCMHSLNKADLLEISTSFIGDIAGIIISALASKKMSRIVALRMWALLNVMTTIPLFFTIIRPLEYTALLSFKFFVSGFWYLLWMTTVETFPTVVRGAATSFISALGDVGGIAGSVLVYSLFPVSPELVVGLFLAASLIKLLASLFWIQDTKDKTMLD